MFLANLAAGMTVDDILRDYPFLEREDIQACFLLCPSHPGSSDFVRSLRGALLNLGHSLHRIIVIVDDRLCPFISFRRNALVLT